MRIHLTVFILRCLIVLLATIQVSFAGPKGSQIAKKAQSYVGSTSWAYNKKKSPLGSNTNKCNLFVADVLKSVGADAPNRWPWYSPIGAREWEKPNSSYLKGNNCWSLCNGSKQRGDVLALDGHVGIVTRYRKTTSATYTEVVENDWGFRSGQDPTCWRYTCS